MGKSILLSLLFLLCATAGFAQESAPKPIANATPDQMRLEALSDRVSSLPPEYKADLGFAILDADLSSLSLEQKRSLLDDIFHSATRAHYPYGLTEASSQIHGDLVAGLLGNSRLDTLEIQARSVERALPLSPQFAEQLFEEMKLKEDRASCTNANVEDLSPFYSVAAKILEDPGIKIVSGQDKESYLLNLVANTSIPAQIGPLADLIATVPTAPDELGQIEGAFDSALNRITASDREMTAAEQGGNLSKAIKHLSSRFAQAGVYQGRLLAGYRSFLLRGLTPESCSDYSLDRAVVARAFNALLPDSLESSPDLAPLTAVQLEPQSKGTSAPKPGSLIDPQIMTRLYRIAAAEVARSTEEYRSGQPSMIVPESSDVDDVIHYAVSPPPAASECPVCNFEAKGGLLDALVQLLPPGSDLEKAEYAEVDDLSFSDMQKENPVAWLHLFKKLLNASRDMSSQTRNTLTAEAKKGTLRNLCAGS